MSTRSDTSTRTGAHRRGPDVARVWVWAGVVLFGAVVAGLGVALLSLPLGIAGAALVVIGALLAKHAGIMSDVRVKGGVGIDRRAADTGPGGAGGDGSISPVAAAAGRRPLAAGSAAAAAWVAVAAGGWLCLSAFALPYPFSESGQDHINRDAFIGLAMVLMTLPLARSGELRPVVTAAALLVAAAEAALLVGSGGTTAVVVNASLVVAVFLAALGTRTIAMTRRHRPRE